MYPPILGKTPPLVPKLLKTLNYLITSYMQLQYTIHILHIYYAQLHKKNISFHPININTNIFKYYYVG